MGKGARTAAAAKTRQGRARQKPLVDWDKWLEFVQNGNLGRINVCQYYLENPDDGSPVSHLKVMEELFADAVALDVVELPGERLTVDSYELVVKDVGAVRQFIEVRLEILCDIKLVKIMNGDFEYRVKDLDL